jgi:hypothetical protein
MRSAIRAKQGKRQPANSPALFRPDWAMLVPCSWRIMKPIECGTVVFSATLKRQGRIKDESKGIFKP